MLNINVTIRDVALNINEDCEIVIAEDQPVRELINEFVRRLRWPQKDIDAAPIRYALRIERDNARVLLTGDELIRLAGLQNDDILYLGPHWAEPSASRAAVPATAAAAEPPPYTMQPMR